MPLTAGAGLLKSPQWRVTRWTPEWHQTLSRPDARDAQLAPASLLLGAVRATLGLGPLAHVLAILDACTALRLDGIVPDPQFCGGLAQEDSSSQKACTDKGLHESSPTGHDCSVITRRGLRYWALYPFGKRRSLSAATGSRSNLR
jgi:hypothetical protein